MAGQLESFETARASPASPTMTGTVVVAPEFPGFPDFRANVTFVPLQFFTVVLPHRSRGCVRLVGFMIRRFLGWVDTDGNPTHEQLEFGYRELMEGAGLSREAIAEALAEAQAHRFIHCVRAPCPDRPGQPAQSGVYRLRWSDRYTDSPADFDGFFRREAVAVIENGRPATHARAARKNIPNAFFDYVLRRERLSVTRVVGAMLFRSIQWGQGGERKVPVSLSVTELCRLTHLSRRHVHEAIHEALRRGYVERMQEGRFDPRAGAASHAATYRIRWTSQPVNPVCAAPPFISALAVEDAPAPYPFSDRSKKGHGAAVRNGIRDQSEKGNGNRSEKGNDISIKSSIKKLTTAAGESELPVATAAAADGILAKLLAAGFDHRAARHLVGHHATEIIDQQIAWLPQRKADTNRLGLLRRAIEGNWPQPEASALPVEHASGAPFVRHFEAALHGYAEPPASCSPKEAEQAARFLRELTGTATGFTEAAAAEWGRRFGQFARAKSPPKPWFIWVLRVHGGEFLRQCRQAVRRDEKVFAAQSRQAHEETFTGRYEEYLREIEAGTRREQPALYAAFEAHRDETATRFNFSEKTRAMLASETGRLSAFADFMREHGGNVLEFWEWDRQLNPECWQDVAAVQPASSGAS